MHPSRRFLGFFRAGILLMLCLGNGCKSHHDTAKRSAAPKEKPKPVAKTTEAPAEDKETAKANKDIRSKYAQLLGVSTKDIKNEKLYTLIDEWYGVPYKYGGKDKKGIDCSGFTAMLYQSVYNKKISPATKYLVDETTKINSTNLKEGDLVFFNIADGKISHVGVYLQNNKFVHASTKKGVMINDLNEAYYKKYFCRAGRVK